MPQNNSNQGKSNYDLTGKSKFELSLIASQYELLFEGLDDLVERITHLDKSYPTKKTIENNTKTTELVKSKIVRLEKIVVCLGILVVIQTILTIIILLLN